MTGCWGETMGCLPGCTGCMASSKCHWNRCVPVLHGTVCHDNLCHGTLCCRFFSAPPAGQRGRHPPQYRPAPQRPAAAPRDRGGSCHAQPCALLPFDCCCHVFCEPALSLPLFCSIAGQPIHCKWQSGALPSPAVFCTQRHASSSAAGPRGSRGSGRRRLHCGLAQQPGRQL